ncbi:MAG: hypothetical protein WDW38_003597 [Sanguina aurantia]
MHASAAPSSAGVTRIQDETATIAKHCNDRKICGSAENAVMKRLARRGFCAEQRPTAWYLLSGGQQRAEAAAPGTYQSLIDKAEAQPTFLDLYETIRRDCDSALHTARPRSVAPTLQRASGKESARTSPPSPPSTLEHPYLRKSSGALSPDKPYLRKSSGLLNVPSSVPKSVSKPAGGVATVPPAAGVAGAAKGAVGGAAQVANPAHAGMSPRTPSGNSLLSSYSNSSTEAASDALANMLLAFLQLDPARAYNGAYARVGATLLGVFGAADEERAFWTLAAMLEGRLFPYTQGELLSGAKVEVKVLQQLLPGKAPRVAAALAGMRVDVGVLAGSWFSSLFTTVLSSEVTLRVWDCMLCDGPKVLIRVALALLQKYESSIVGCTEVELLRRLLPVRIQHGSTDAGELIKSAFQGTLRGAQLCSIRSALISSA